jgi:hypothetical protein
MIAEEENTCVQEDATNQDDSSSGYMQEAKTSGTITDDNICRTNLHSIQTVEVED